MLRACFSDHAESKLRLQLCNLQGYQQHPSYPYTSRTHCERISYEFAMEKQTTHVLLIIQLVISLAVLVIAIYCAHQVSKQDSGNTNHAINHVAQQQHLYSIDDYRKQAEATLPQTSWLVIHDGALTQNTIHDNVAAYRQYRIMPKALVDISSFSSDVTVFGQTLSMPIALSPVAFLRMVHPEGDAMSARAAHAQNTVFGLSAHSSSSIEEVASMAPDTIKWQQVYLYNNFSITLDLLRRAENAGFKAIIVTIDKPVKTIRYNFFNGAAAVPSHVVRKSFEKYGDWEWVKRNWVTDEQTWEKLRDLCQVSTLPVIVKGILNKDDVEKCRDSGASGIIVSNHGGRTLDQVPATIDVLPGIVEAANNTMEIFIDGGIRSGIDVFKAVALGAKMVFLGRPAFWGLASEGQAGVEGILSILHNEFINTAQMAGAARMEDINSSFLVKY